MLTTVGVASVECHANRKHTHPTIRPTLRTRRMRCGYHVPRTHGGGTNDSDQGPSDKIYSLHGFGAARAAVRVLPNNQQAIIVPG